MMEEIGNVDFVDKVKVKVGNSHHPFSYTYVSEDLLSWKLEQFINIMKGYPSRKIKGIV